MTSERTAPHLCPECGMAADAVTGMRGAKVPTDGDVSICAYCLHVGVFTTFAGSLQVREATEEERAGWAEDQALQLYLRNIAKIKAQGATGAR